MKKLGFTLSEVIIALGIIGVIAAITAPLIGGIMPDKDKVQVLKYYKAITDVNNDLLNDVSLYRKYWDNGGYCQGLGCTKQPTNPAFSDEKFSSLQKYQNLLKEHLDINEGGYLQDGVRLGFGRQSLSGRQVYEAEVYIITDSNGWGCSYSSSCKKPTRFEFNVDTYGKVTGHDPLTKAYLENPHKLNDRKKDYARAKELSSN